MSDGILQEDIVSLETRMAYQEKMIDDLNKIIYQQQQQIDFLMVNVPEIIRKLARMESGENVQHAQDEAPPPHY